MSRISEVDCSKKANGDYVIVCRKNVYEAKLQKNGIYTIFFNGVIVMREYYSGIKFLKKMIAENDPAFIPVFPSN
jgi:hypothetical protein